VGIAGLAMRRLIFLLAFVCGGSASGASISVGSKSHTEARLLGEILAQAIESQTDLEVVRRMNLGGTTLVHNAMVSGQLDLYAEYTGTGWAAVLKQQEHPGSPLQTYVAVQRAYETQFDMAWLAPFGFSNTYTLTMREEHAEELGIRTISDLLAHEDLRYGVTHEFMSRKDGVPGLLRAYGLKARKRRGMDHGLAYTALLSGEVDVIDAWSTDGKLSRYPVRVLEDDLRFFPPYHAVPLIRRAVLRDHPEVGEALDRLAFTLGPKLIRRLNYRLEIGGESVAQVAADFLKTSRGEAGTSNMERPGLLAFARERLRPTFELLLQHCMLSGVALLIAALISIPGGIWLSRRPRLAEYVLKLAGAVQTIPSLALFAFIIAIPAVGLGATPAITALVLYALLPMLRNTTTGIQQVEPRLVDTAVGIGLTARQVLWRIELPLALPMLMAGVRTAAVISVGVATLGAFVGAGGLGDPIITGLSLNDTRLVLSGALPAALLAYATDTLLGRWQARLGGGVAPG